MESGDEFIPFTQSVFHPMPANCQITLATQPMRIAPATFPLCDYLCALCDQIEGCNGQHTTQALSGVRRADQRRLPLEALGFSIQAVLFDVKTPSILLKRLELRGLIAHHKPVFLTVEGTTQGEMDRAIFLLGQVDRLPEECLTWRQRNTTHLAMTLSGLIYPKTPFDTNAPMPTQPHQLGHEMRVGEPTVRGKDDMTPARKQLRNLLQQTFIHLIGDTTARVFQHRPHHRYCPTTIHERDTHHTIGIPQR